MFVVETFSHLLFILLFILFPFCKYVTVARCLSIYICCCCFVLLVAGFRPTLYSTSIFLVCAYERYMVTGESA